MRYTLSYLATGPRDAILVDPGWSSEEGWQHLLEGLKRTGVGIRGVTGIVVTHRHGDHLGLAERARQASGAWVGLGRNETLGLPESGGDDAWIGADRALLHSWGVPASRVGEIVYGEQWLSAERVLARPDVRFADGEHLQGEGMDLEMVATPGHTEGHICLIDHVHGLLLSGDHVLPRITPNVSLQRGGPENPLRDYCRSLERMRCHEDMEVCPAHEYRFQGIGGRVDELLSDARSRSDEVLEIIDARDAQSVWDIARNLTWSRGWDSLVGPPLRLALAETASHVALLRSQGAELDIPLAEGRQK
ncbi:MBL fold metallo-hydrolase [Citricoccus parietis]